MGFRDARDLSSKLWFVPIVCVAAGILASIGTLLADRWAGDGLIPRPLTGGPDGALAILSTVAASMVTLTTLVLTVTMVVVQLAMQQFSPRVLRTILRDRPSQAAIGIFVATFAQAMLVMPEIRAANGSDQGYVPGISIVVSYVLVLICIMVLVSYVNHIGLALRAASLIESVGEETRQLLREVYPDRPIDADDAPPVPTGEPDRQILASASGVVALIDAGELVELARQSDVVLVVRPRVGDFVPEGAPLVDVYGRRAIPEQPLFHSIVLGLERTLDQDVAFGIRMLVDVAVKSASDATSDPTTAVQAIDRIHDCLRQLAGRPFGSGRHVDAAGTLRLVVPNLAWGGYVHLACDELRIAGAHSVQVTRRLASMLDDLLAVAPEERRPCLVEQRELLESAVRRTLDDERDVQFALGSDPQGIGSGADVERTPALAAD